LLVHTWPRGTVGLLALRDFMVTDDSGGSLVEATSTWLLLDIEKKRPLRPEFLGERMPYYQEAVMVSDAKKVEDFSEADLMEQPGKLTFPMLASDLDPNGHVNNTVYARVLSDYLANQCGDFYFNEIDVNFLAETFRNETLSVKLYKKPGEALPYGAKIISLDGLEKARFSFLLA
jgi:acyl-ACP thioesterase